MREIKFRGKHINKNGKRHIKEWIYGTYYKHEKVTLCPIGLKVEDIKENELHLIIDGGFSDWNLPAKLNCYEVLPETVGQYTGIKDKNGKEIYEGDILSFYDINGVVKFGLHDDDVYNGWYVYVKNTNTQCELNQSFSGAEIVGNIYENSKLVMNERRH